MGCICARELPAADRPGKPTAASSAPSTTTLQLVRESAPNDPNRIKVTTPPSKPFALRLKGSGSSPAARSRTTMVDEAGLSDENGQPLQNNAAGPPQCGSASGDSCSTNAKTNPNLKNSKSFSAAGSPSTTETTTASTSSAAASPGGALSPNDVDVSALCRGHRGNSDSSDALSEESSSSTGSSSSTSTSGGGNLEEERDQREEVAVGLPSQTFRRPVVKLGPASCTGSTVASAFSSAGVVGVRCGSDFRPRPHKNTGAGNGHGDALEYDEEELCAEGFISLSSTQALRETFEAHFAQLKALKSVASSTSAGSDGDEDDPASTRAPMVVALTDDEKANVKQLLSRRAKLLATTLEQLPFSLCAADEDHQVQDESCARLRPATGVQAVRQCAAQFLHQAESSTFQSTAEGAREFEKHLERELEVREVARMCSGLGQCQSGGAMGGLANNDGGPAFGFPQQPQFGPGNAGGTSGFGGNYPQSHTQEMQPPQKLHQHGHGEQQFAAQFQEGNQHGGISLAEQLFQHGGLQQLQQLNLDPFQMDVLMQSLKALNLGEVGRVNSTVQPAVSNSGPPGRSGEQYNSAALSAGVSCSSSACNNNSQSGRGPCPKTKLNDNDNDPESSSSSDDLTCGNGLHDGNAATRPAGEEQVQDVENYFPSDRGTLMQQLCEGPGSEQYADFDIYAHDSLIQWNTAVNKTGVAQKLELQMPSEGAREAECTVIITEDEDDGDSVCDSDFSFDETSGGGGAAIGGCTDREPGGQSGNGNSEAARIFNPGGEPREQEASATASGLAEEGPPNKQPEPDRDHVAGGECGRSDPRKNKAASLRRRGQRRGQPFGRRGGPSRKKACRVSFPDELAQLEQVMAVENLSEYNRNYVSPFANLHQYNNDSLNVSDWNNNGPSYDWNTGNGTSGGWNDNDNCTQSQEDDREAADAQVGTKTSSMSSTPSGDATSGVHENGNFACFDEADSDSRIDDKQPRPSADVADAL